MIFFLKSVNFAFTLFGVAKGGASALEVVETHAAHGHLWQRFLLLLSNRRTGNYGGSFENPSACCKLSAQCKKFGRLSCRCLDDSLLPTVRTATVQQVIRLHY